LVTEAETGEETTSATPAWRRAARGFVLTLIVMAVALVAAAVGYERIHAEKLLPGVTVGGVPVGGLDRAAAEAALRAALPSLSDGSLTIQIGTQVQTITYAEIGRDYDMATMLDQAYGVARAGGIIEELRTLVQGVPVPVAMRWDNTALIDRVAAAARSAGRTPVDASIQTADGRYVVVPAVDGQTVDETEIYQAALSIVSDPARTSATISATPITLPASISTGAAQSAVDQVESAAQGPLTVTVATESATVSSETIRSWLKLAGTTPADWRVVIETEGISQVVAALTSRVAVTPVNASFVLEAAGPRVVPGKDGQQLDVQSGVATIVDAITKRVGGATVSTARLAVVPLTADFSTADAQALAARVEVLGTWTTKFTPSPFNGDGVNIRRPAELIDGTVLEPGEMFDFVTAAEPFTKRNGYTDGAAIIHGNTKMDGVLGGGLCSASTTLFNAAARAGLQVDARHNHYYYIGRYPVGLDATIWVNGRIRKTMAFTNDSEYPILIRAITSRRRVTFEIWGVPDGRRVSFAEPRIEDETEAKTFIEYTDDLPAGVLERVEFPADGFDSWVTRTVRDSHGAVIHDDTFFSAYGKVDGLIKLGRYATDPPAGTRIPARGHLGV
jgi:vancomycin resistance protein YoaR